MTYGILPDIAVDCLNQQTISAYRNYFRTVSVDHPFSKLEDNEFLHRIGAAAMTEGHQYHPTGAGLLMFGNEHDIVRHYPGYFLDFRCEFGYILKLSNHLFSSSGDWSGNLFDFYFKVIYKIDRIIPTPFRLENGIRIDDTAVHKAAREVLANCLFHADYHSSGGVLIKLENTTLTLENPGSISVGSKQMLTGGLSASRNNGLMKMFSLIGIGQRAGNGVPKILDAWKNAGFESPQFIELTDPRRTRVVLSFVRARRAPLVAEGKPLAKKTLQHIDNIIAYLGRVTEADADEIARTIKLSPERTRRILEIAPDIEAVPYGRKRFYRLRWF